MALQIIKQGFFLPLFEFCAGSLAINDSQLLFDAAGEKVAFVFRIPKSGTISEVGFRTGTVSNAKTVRVSLETVSLTTGAPTGTNYGGSTPGTITPVTVAYHYVDLGTPALAVQGDYVAVVFQFDSTAGSVYIAASSYRFTAPMDQFGYALQFITSWTKLASKRPIIHFKYDDNSIEPILGASNLLTASTTSSFNLNSAPDEYGTLFQLPFPARLCGVYAFLVLSANIKVILYDSNDNILSQTLLDKDVMGETAVWPRFHMIQLQDSILLDKNSWYRITFQAQEATNVGISIFQTYSASLMDVYPLGQKAILTQRTNVGAWTDTDTKRIDMHLIFDGFDDGVGAGETSHVF